MKRLRHLNLLRPKVSGKEIVKTILTNITLFKKLKVLVKNPVHPQNHPQ